MANRLKPCPFCGAITTYGDEAAVTELGRGLWVVICGFCYCQSPLGTDEKSAIAAWNRRAKPKVKR